MTLDELDALIEADPDAAAALLTEPDWISTMRDPRAAAHQVQREPSGVIYRGLWVWVHSPGPSRLVGSVEAQALGLLETEPAPGPE